MTHKKIAMEHEKKIALVAHDNKKRDLVEWAKFNQVLLAHHKIYATGTTGEILEQELGFKIFKLQSGPLGGNQQIGAKIADAEASSIEMDLRHLRLIRETVRSGQICVHPMKVTVICSLS